MLKICRKMGFLSLPHNYRLDSILVFQHFSLYYESLIFHYFYIWTLSLCPSVTANVFIYASVNIICKITLRSILCKYTLKNTCYLYTKKSHRRHTFLAGKNSHLVALLDIQSLQSTWKIRAHFYQVTWI